MQTLSLPPAGVAEKMHANPFGWMGWGYRRAGIYAPLFLGPGPGASR